MTRQEFIRWYAANSGLDEGKITDLGVCVGGRDRIALPCRCGEFLCRGWAMVSAESVLWHLFQNSDESCPDPMREISADDGIALAREFLQNLENQDRSA